MTSESAFTQPEQRARPSVASCSPTILTPHPPLDSISPCAHKRNWDRAIAGLFTQPHYILIAPCHRKDTGCNTRRSEKVMRACLHFIPILRAEPWSLNLHIMTQKMALLEAHQLNLKEFSENNKIKCLYSCGEQTYYLNVGRHGNGKLAQGRREHRLRAVRSQILTGRQSLLPCCRLCINSITK